MADFKYCPCCDGPCPYWNLIYNDVFICEEDCPYWSGEF